MAAQRVLVTGGSRGLGYEFAKQFKANGAEVIATVRNPKDAPAELSKLGVEFLRLDVCKPDQIARVATDVTARGGLDLLINNAGVMAEDSTIESLNANDFESVFSTNVVGPALVFQALLPALRAGKDKAVWNISSQLGSIATAAAGFSYAYSTSKAALNMLTARLAKDLAQEGFTLVAFHPGWNRTDMGGANATLDPAESVAKLIATGKRLGPRDSGTFRQIDGTVIPW